MNDKEYLFSTNETDQELFEILFIQKELSEGREQKLGLIKPFIVTAMEICLKAHRKNGCTSNQLKEMHNLLVKAQDLLK